MLDALITYGSVAAGLYVGWRMFRRSVRAVWGKIMSWQGSAGPVLPVSRAGSELPKTSSPGPVLLQQNQVHQTTFDEVMTFLARHNLSDEEAIKILAILKRNNDHFISANKIRDLVGGADAVVKARVAALRPKPPAPKVPPSIRRPQNGW